MSSLPYRIPGIHITDTNPLSDPDLKFWISGFDTLSEGHGLSFTAGTGVVVSNAVKRNNKSSIFIPANASISSTNAQTLAALAIGDSDFTIEVWVYSTSIDSAYAEVFTMLQSSNNSVSMRYGNSGYSNRYQVPIGNTSGTTVPNYYTTELTKALTTLNAWHHYALVRKAGHVYAFYDGAVIFDKVQYNNTTLTIAPTSIRMGYGTTNGFALYMQDLRVYTRALYDQAFTPE